MKTAEMTTAPVAEAGVAYNQGSGAAIYDVSKSVGRYCLRAIAPAIKRMAAVYGIINHSVALPYTLSAVAGVGRLL